MLLSRYDVLLLDEPTNDLDFAALDRLETLRQPAARRPCCWSATTGPSWSGPSPGVIELDEHTRRATRYEGGWLAYLEEQATARRHAEEAYERVPGRRVDTLTDRTHRQRQWAVKGVGPAPSRSRGTTTSSSGTS